MSPCRWGASDGCSRRWGCRHNGRCGGPTSRTRQRWKTEQFPAIRAAAAQLGATVHFVDEAGVRSDYHAGTTWAPVGVTPVVATTGARHAVNLIPAVTAQGALRFSTFFGSFTGATFVDFLKKLLADAPGPVFVVVDGHPAHRVGGSSCTSFRDTHPSLTRTNGCGRTSRQIAWAGLASPASTNSTPKSRPRCTGCRRRPTSSAASSLTPTCVTSPPEQSTYQRTP